MDLDENFTRGQCARRNSKVTLFNLFQNDLVPSLPVSKLKKLTIKNEKVLKRNT